MKQFLRRFLLIAFCLGVFLAAWAFWWEPRRLVTREVKLELSCWQGSPLRIAAVSDLHIGSPYTGLEKLDAVVAAVNAGRPDIVVLLGDFVVQRVAGGHFVAPEAIASRLAALQAPDGVYAVLGNHDRWLDPARVTAALQSAGIRVIDDAAVAIPNRGGPLWVAGVSDFLTAEHDVGKALREVPPGAVVLLITHNPDVFPSVPERVCLSIAGHTHGGQVSLPFLGRPIVPSQYGGRYAAGQIDEHGKHFFVTSGVGTSILPVRFRVPPEVVFLTAGAK